MSYALFKNKQIGIKIESSSGTPESVAVGDYGIEVTELSAASNVEMIDKNVFRSSISGTTSRIGKLSATVDLGGEFKNSGTLNTKPKIDTILQTSRFMAEVVKSATVSAIVGTIARGVSLVKGGTSNATALVIALESTTLYYIPRTGTLQTGETITAGTFSATLGTISATNQGFLYSPSSTPSSEKTATIKLNDGGMTKQLYGCASSLKLDLSTSDFPKWSANFSGILDSATWGAKATDVTGIVYESNAPAVVVNAQLKIGSTFAPVTSSISLDLGNAVNLIEDLNSNSWYKYSVVTERSASGSIGILSDLDQNADLYSKLFAGQTAELSFKIGSGAGNQIDIICPAVQYTGISESDSNSFLSQSINIKMTGDDKEILFWFR